MPVYATVGFSLPEHGQGLHIVTGRDLHYNQFESAVKAQRLLTSDSEAKSESTNCYHSSA